MSGATDLRVACKQCPLADKANPNNGLKSMYPSELLHPLFSLIVSSSTVNFHASLTTQSDCKQTETMLVSLAGAVVDKCVATCPDPDNQQLYAAKIGTAEANFGTESNYMLVRFRDEFGCFGTLRTLGQLTDSTRR